MIDLKLWKEKKKELKLTFNELSNKSGIPKRTLEDIFTQRTPSPRIDTVQKIEQALGIGWTDEELAQGVLPTVVRNLDGDENELLEAYRELGVKKGKSAQELIQKIIIEMCDL